MFNELTSYMKNNTKILQDMINDKSSPLGDVLRLIQDLASSNKCNFIIRKFDPEVIDFHMRDGGKCKPLHLKGKSASTKNQFLNGLVPYDPWLSKVGWKGPEEVKKFLEKNNDTLKNSEEQLKKITNAMKDINLKPGIIDRQMPDDFEDFLQTKSLGAESINMLVNKTNAKFHGHDVYYFPSKVEGIKPLSLSINEGMEDTQNTAKDDIVYAIKDQNGKYRMFQENEGELYLTHEIESESVPNGYEAKMVEVMSSPKLEIINSNDQSTLIANGGNKIIPDLDMLSVQYSLQANVSNSRFMDKKAYMDDFIKGLVKDNQAPVEKNIIIRTVKKLINNFKRKTSAKKIKEEDIKALEGIKEEDIKATVVSALVKTDSKKHPEMLEKINNFYTSISHISGMGGSIEETMALVAVLRAETDAITHGDEVFNIHFPQDLDSEWIIIDKNGDITSISGKEEYLEYFNKHINTNISEKIDDKKKEELENNEKLSKTIKEKISQGKRLTLEEYKETLDQMSEKDKIDLEIMPITPNPNWGWAFDENKGEYYESKNLKNADMDVKRYLSGRINDINPKNLKKAKQNSQKILGEDKKFIKLRQFEKLSSLKNLLKRASSNKHISKRMPRNKSKNSLLVRKGG